MKLNTVLASLLVLSAVSMPAVAADIAAGQKKAEACIACHGPNGNAPNGQFPVLAGQSARYIGLQLKDFKEGRRKDHPVISPMAAPLRKSVV